jgi:aminocarboxymuconate-semialdehyde decarboxylase
MSRTVDIHAHYVSPRLVAEAERNGERYGVKIGRNADGAAQLTFLHGMQIRPFLRELCDLALRLPEMDAAGVGLQVVSAWTDMAGDDLPVAEGARWARLQNETMAEDVRAFPGRFGAMGTLPTQDVGLAVAELDYIVRDLGMRSIQLVSSVNGKDLDHPDFRPLWKRLHDLDVFVLLHPPFRPVGLDRCGDYFLNNLFSFPADTTIAAGRLIFSGILDEYPGLKICLAHAGGFLPYQIGRLDRGFAAHQACRRSLKRQPSELLRSFMFDTLTHNDDALSFLIATVGAERVVYGSDYPFEMLDPAGPKRVETLKGLTAAQRADILGDNMRATLTDAQPAVANPTLELTGR